MNSDDIKRSAGGGDEIVTTTGTALVSDIEQQVSTAHKYPRSVGEFRNQAMTLVNLSPAIANECVYALPRDGKTIEGPSARFAEILISTWGNCRAGARVVEETRDTIVAQGVFHDLQNNSQITYEVTRRITTKTGRRFSADMVAVVANAACSIALRNAALKGVPKALWQDIYESARETIMGNIETLANRRARMLERLIRYGITNDIALEYLGKPTVDDIDLDDMVKLTGLGVALRDGDATVESILAQLKKAKPNQAPADDTTPPAADTTTAADSLAETKTEAPAEKTEATTTKTTEPGPNDPAPTTKPATPGPDDPPAPARKKRAYKRRTTKAKPAADKPAAENKPAETAAETASQTPPPDVSQSALDFFGADDAYVNEMTSLQNAGANNE